MINVQGEGELVTRREDVPHKQARIEGSQLVIMKKVITSIHVRMDNMVALSSLMKMGGIRTKK